MFGPLEFAQGPTKLEQLQAQYNIKRVRVSAGINIYHQMGEIGRVRTFFAASGRLVSASHHGLLIPGTSGSPVLGSDGNAIGILQEIDVSGKAFGITFNSPSVANALKRAIDRY